MWNFLKAFFHRQTPKELFSLHASVFICGAVLMVFEMAGSRMLAPYLGTSTYVWTSIIGVILGSLSIGYWLGGKWADKEPTRSFYARTIFFSACAVLYTFFALSFLSMIYRWSFLAIEWRSLIASVLLFAPASILLGVVSPYAVKLKLVELSHSASTVGNLYALSTLGSIAGTFFAGYFLIPHVGTVNIIFVLSLTLVVTACLITKTVWKKGIALIILIAVIYALNAEIMKDVLARLHIRDVDTAYARVTVFEGTDAKTHEPVRYLSTDPFGVQSGMFLKSDDLVFDYTKFYRLADAFHPTISRALMLGGCAYSYPKTFLKEHPEATLDVVEIDPGMTALAKTYFRLQDDPRLNIFHEDGRTFINRPHETYDVIFNDAFNSFSSVPFQLTTKEALKRQYALLADNGVVVTNVISSINGKTGKFLRAEYETYKTVFPSVFLFPVDAPQNGNKVQNIMIVAGKTTSLDSSAGRTSLQTYLANKWTGNVTADVPVLTDDFAPVDYYKFESL